MLYFFFHCFILDLTVLSQAMKPLFFFFIISSSLISSDLSHQALISLISLIRSHLSSSHLQATPSQPLPSPFRAVPAHTSARRRRSHLSDLSQALISQPSPSPSPSHAIPAHSVPAHASARSTSGQCSLFFCSEFFNCCFGLIFLGLVLFCGEKWCCPYVVLGKIKKTFVLE